jgi:hypothetical protein
MDIIYADHWTISDNVFIGIRGRTGEARGAVFLWHESQDCAVERNVIVDCDSGICLGNSYRPQQIKVHCRRCVVRNNFVTRAPENGILADYTEDCVIAQNTVHDPESRLKRLVRLVHDNGGLLVANNLLSGPPMRVETDSSIRFQDNVTRELTASFVSPQEGNLHLKEAIAGVVDAARLLPQAGEDIDRQPRRDPWRRGRGRVFPACGTQGFVNPHSQRAGDRMCEREIYHCPFRCLTVTRKDGPTARLYHFLLAAGYAPRRFRQA